MVCGVYYEYNDETYSDVEHGPYHVRHIFSKEEDALSKVEYLTKDRIESIIHEESVWSWQYALESAKYPLDPDMHDKYTDILKKISDNEENHTNNKLSDEDMDTLITACVKAKVFYFVLETELDV
jgi:hypothetical protein